MNYIQIFQMQQKKNKTRRDGSQTHREVLRPAEQRTRSALRSEPEKKIKTNILQDEFALSVLAAKYILFI